MVIFSIIVWTQLSLFIKIAYKATDYVNSQGYDSVMISSQALTKNLCELDPKTYDPDSVKAHIYPWQPTFYESSIKKRPTLPFLEKNGRGIYENFILGLKYPEEYMHVKFKSFPPQYLIAAINTNSLTRKKTYKYLLDPAGYKPYHNSTSLHDSPMPKGYKLDKKIYQEIGKSYRYG